MKGRDLLDHVFDHLNIVEKDYFGICYQAETNKMVRMTSRNLYRLYLYLRCVA